MGVQLIQSPMRVEKRPLHPGYTRRECGYTASELDLLTAGVCRELGECTERGERWAHRLMLGAAVLGLLVAFVVWW